MKAHVTRSSGSSLDIEICTQDVTQTFRASVGILIDCAHRWRSLIIRDHVDGTAFSILLRHMQHNAFPSLTHVSVEYVPSHLGDRLSRFYSERCPHLQHLDLGRGFIRSLNFPPPPSLTSLACGFGNGNPASILPRLTPEAHNALTLWIS